MIDIETPMTVENLFRLLEIASWVDSKLPKPKGKPRCVTNFDLFPPILPDPKYANGSGLYIKIIPTPRQIRIWEFCLNLYLLATPEQREFIKYKNYPHPKSYRALKRLYLHISHETLRKNYIKVLSRLCAKANRIGIKELLI